MILSMITEVKQNILSLQETILLHVKTIEVMYTVWYIPALRYFNMKHKCIVQ